MRKQLRKANFAINNAKHPRATDGATPEKTMAITATSLQHPTIRCKLHGAMIRAAARSRISPNGCGACAVGKIEVFHLRGENPRGFVFMSGLDDITKTVRKALRAD